jgi:hypothetical protein
MASKAKTPKGHAAHDPAEQIRERAKTGFDIAREFGHTFEWGERYLFWWKYLGFRKALAVFVVFVLPVINAEWTRRLADTVVQSAAEYYGVEVEVGDWDGALLGAHATAKQVVVKVSGTFAKPEIFKADAITVDLSVWRRLRTGHWIKSITVERPELYFERTLAGRWNFAEFVGTGTDASPGAKANAPGFQRANLQAHAAPREGTLPLAADVIDLKDVRIQWVENLPGNSGGGIIHSSVATIYVDGARVKIDNVGIDNRPIGFQIEGRSADGRFSLDGETLLRAAGGRATKATIYVENVGLAAFGRIAPQALLVPLDGTMTGNIELAMDETHVDCRANVELRNVRLAANRTGVLAPASADALDRDASAFRANRRVLAACEGDPRNEGFRVAHAVQFAVTREAVADGPPTLRQAALVDDQRAKGTLATAAVETLRNDLARRAGVSLGRVFGPQAAAAIEQSLTAPTNGAVAGVQPHDTTSAHPEGNAVTRGVKGMGSGIKRLFGGGKKHPPKKKQPAS